MEATAIGILKFCAWLNLAVGLALGVSVWSNPDVILSVAFAAAGLIGWAFFLVVCSIAASLIEIRANTTPPVKSRLFDS